MGMVLISEKTGELVIVLDIGEMCECDPYFLEQGWTIPLYRATGMAIGNYINFIKEIQIIKKKSNKRLLFGNIKLEYL